MIAALDFFTVPTVTFKLLIASSSSNMDVARSGTST
jgi:hypothetical protein